MLIILAFPVMAAVDSVPNYGDTVTASISAAEKTAMNSLNEEVRKQGNPKLVIDPRIVVAARDIAGEIQGDIDNEELTSSSNVQKTFRVYGLYDTSTNTKAFSFETMDDIRSSVLLGLSDRSIKATHIGAGVAPGGKDKLSICVVILTTRLADIKPFPKKVKAPATVKLEGQMVYAGKGLTPRVLLTVPEGGVKDLEPDITGQRFRVEVPFREGAGRYVVQVLAKSEYDSTTAAILSVDASGSNGKVRSQVSVTGKEPSPETVKEAEDLIFQMTNQVRRKLDLKPLVRDRRLEAMARSQSRDMFENDFFGHNSPTRGSVERRAAAAGLSGYEVDENLAINTSLLEAMNNLLKSPVHRAPIVSDEYTHLGVGVVFDNSNGTRHYYITQEFAKLR